MQAVRGCQLKTPYINCFHCEKVAEEPRLCPRCARGFCNTCLFLAVTSLREECPSCGVRVREEEYLQPQAVLMLAESIAGRVRKQVRRGQQREMCGQHDLPLSYFCVECNHPLCSDCALLTNTHTGHRFVSYRDIYERIKKRVFDEFPRLDRKIKHLKEHKNMLYNRTESLYEEYRRYKKVFEEAYITYTESVERAGKLEEEAIAVRFESSQHRLAELEHLRDSIYEEMEKKTQLTLIKQAGALLESIRALAAQEPPPSAPPASQQSDLEELVPDYVSWRYRLEGFSSKNGIVYSEGKLINGVEWRLKVYPKGNGLAREKYLSVFVEMSKALGVQNKYEYRIELLNPMDPALNVRREYCSTFEIGECWGYNQFEPLEQLLVKEFIQDDALTFQIGIRNRNYRSLVNDQLLYIQLLQAQLKQKQQQESSKKIKTFRQKRPKEKQGDGVISVAVQRGECGQEVPFEQSHAYGLIQEFLKKEQQKRE